MAEDSATSGIGGQIRELFPLVTKFVLGLAGAPFKEVCQGSEADEHPKHMPQQTAGAVLVLAAVVYLTVVARTPKEGTDRAVEIVGETLLQYALVSVAAAVLPFSTAFQVTKTEAVCMVAIYWMPWYAVMQAVYAYLPQATVWFYLLPVLTAGLGMWSVRRVSRMGWRFVAGLLMMLGLCLVNLWVSGLT